MAGPVISTLSDGTIHPVAFARQIEILDPDEAPLLKLFGTGKGNLKKLGDVRDWPATKLQWLNDTIAPITTTTDGAAGTTTTINVAAGTGVYFRKGDILLITSTGERVLVVSVSTDALTVVRGFGPVTVVTSAAGAEITRVGRVMPEGYTTYETGNLTATTLAYNYTQIISQAVSVTETERAVSTIGIQDQLDYQIQKLISDGGSAGELPKSLEDTFYYGHRVQRTTTGGTVAATIGTMGGFDTFVTNANLVKVLSRSLTVADVWTELRTIRALGGRATHLIGGGELIEVLNELFPAQNRLPGSKVGGADPLESIVTPHGTIKPVYDYRAPAGVLYFTNPKYVGWVPLREFGYKDYKEIGDNFATDVVGEYTFFVKHGNISHGKLSSISV